MKALGRFPLVVKEHLFPEAPGNTAADVEYAVLKVECAAHFRHATIDV